MFHARLIPLRVDLPFGVRMMAAIAFDPLEDARMLKGSGVSRDEAEVHAKAMIVAFLHNVNGACGYGDNINLMRCLACAGLFPAAYELGGSNELLSPMIMAMFWGVLIASVATLFLLPCFYAMERDLMAKLNPGFARQSLGEVIMYN